MKISLKRVNQAVHFIGENQEGNKIHMDGSEAIGGEDAGVRPMQLLLMAAAGCSGIDVVTLLKKMRQDLVDLQIEVEGTRADTIPAVFTAIHLHYKLVGPLKPEKVEKALSMSITQYCSVSKMLEKAADITYSYEIIAADEV